MTNIQAILAAALKLSEIQRSELAAQLIESLDGPFEDQNEVEEAWRAEAERRLEEIESGRVRTLSWPEARRMILGQANDANAA